MASGHPGDWVWDSGCVMVGASSQVSLDTALRWVEGLGPQEVKEPLCHMILLSCVLFLLWRAGERNGTEYRRMSATEAHLSPD